MILTLPFVADIFLDLLIVVVVIAHLLAAPYTKVEESFNIQATHDVLVYGTPISNIHQKLSSYDHFAFPGAVPRTFIGPLFLATFSQPIVAAVGYEYAQIIARGLLGFFNALALIFFKAQIRTACGPAASRWYGALQASQFHVMFYASRLLPNMFAFGLTTVAYGLLLPTNKPAKANGRIRLSIMLFVFAAVVFRSEVALLFGMNAFMLLIIPWISLGNLIPPFAVSFALSLTITVLVDSYFWQKWLWPELWGFFYNVVQGSSSNWGTSPWYYYFTSSIPKLLLNPLAIPLIVTALRSPAYGRIAKRLVYTSLGFVAVYSIQPHKEARFIFYVVPPLTAAAALGASILTTSHPTKARDDSRQTQKKLSSALIALSVLATSVASAGMLLASSLNYPGGEALAALQQIIRADGHSPINNDSSLVTVHADVLSCMTGVTLFGVAGGDNVPTRHNFVTDADIVVAGSDEDDGKPSAWLLLDKTEDDSVLADANFWLRFDYLLMEDEKAVKGGQWETVAVVEGLSGVQILRPGLAAPESEPAGVKRVGRGARVNELRDFMRQFTGGWWAGPRMAPKIRIMKRVKDAVVVEGAAKKSMATA